jgi:ubiquinone/menaquinone biosynthesis C-methylase UbiE
MEPQTRSWGIERPVVSSSFAFPRGVRGRLAGWIMWHTNRKQDEIVDILEVRPGEQVLEVGFGPGRLIGLLAARTVAAVIHGVEPSPVMLASASRANRAGIQAGRIVLRQGDAQRTGLPDGSVDRVVTVNNVALWPDLEAGVHELRRVLAPGGMLAIAWHGGTAPSPIGARLRLSEDKLQRIDRALRSLFAEVTRQPLTALEVFVAR